MVAAVKTTGYPADLADRRPRRRRARPGGGRPADDPDRQRRRHPAGAGGAAEPAGQLRVQPAQHRGAERLGPRSGAWPGRAGRRDRRLLRRSRPVPSSSSTTMRRRRCRRSTRATTTTPATRTRPGGRRADDAARATAPTRGRSCSSRCRPELLRRRSTWRTCRRRCQWPSGRRSRHRSCREGLRRGGGHHDTGRHVFARIQDTTPELGGSAKRLDGDATRRRSRNCSTPTTGG